MRTPAFMSIVILAAACATQRGPEAVPRSFPDYWYGGEAEISRYRLTQSRYGEPRSGHAVLVFVTEDFRRDLQVKDERGLDPTRSVSVLKLNRIQRFTTGIYDYSLMQSVFTPVARSEEPRTLKTTTSIQDWCGQVWVQLNLEEDEYRLTGHSYFESEADEVRGLPPALLEDELFTLIRLDPDALPTGEIRLIPSAFDARLRHRPLRLEVATASLRDLPGDAERTFELSYASGRQLEITFERAFPHGIVAFRESIGDQVTEARRTHVHKTAYWEQNRRRDADAREALGLEADDIGRR